MIVLHVLHPSAKILFSLFSVRFHVNPQFTNAGQSMKYNKHDYTTAILMVQTVLLRCDYVLHVLTVSAVSQKVLHFFVLLSGHKSLTQDIDLAKGKSLNDFVCFMGC